MRDDLLLLASWADGAGNPSRHDVRAALDGVVGRVVDAFAVAIGLWEEHPQ